MKTRALGGRPLVSCLCVTEDRAAFMPWLLWNFDRQTWDRKELVVIDSSAQPLVVDRDDVRVIRVSRRAGVARKRNLALETAGGEVVTWFDDDDWQHPEKAERLVRALRDGSPFAGSTEGWFLDLQTLGCTRHRSPGGRILFNSAGFRTEAARNVSFPTHVRKASDTRWMEAIRRRFGTGGRALEAPLFFWLCHHGNLSNPSSKRRFNRELSTLQAQFTGDCWGDTASALEALRERLESEGEGDGGRPRKGRVARRRSPARGAEQVRPSPATDPGADTPVTAMIKATVLDAAYLDVMVPHMLRQARYPFAERLVVVDRRREFEGKYRTRRACSSDDLDRALERLLERGEIDRVLEVPYEQQSVAAVNRTYFRRSRVATHATSGGPIYPTLWGMEQATTDHVLQLDADIFFYSDGDSWVARALACMRRDPRLWLMMTHAGPPIGPAGQSLAGANLRRARWDRGNEVWRFRTASTRFFLLDRRTLRGRLPVLGRGGTCRPLEQCISGALAANGAHRGDVGNCRTWHLHAHSHADPFPEWAPGLVDAIEAGRFPRSQAGLYDLNLDKHRDRGHWKALLSEADEQVTASTVVEARGGLRPAVAPEPVSARADTSSPVQVIIPVRDRSPARLQATLASLRWQQPRPARTVIVSHGSSQQTNTDLRALCRDHDVEFESMGAPADPWCKPAALNHGIRLAAAHVRYIMTLDADMILAPNFLGVVVDQLCQATAPGAMVLCRSRDLPRTLRIPARPQSLRGSYDRLRALGRLRGRQACGGVQAALKTFYFDVHGYDEAFTWWGEEDRDMVARAEGYGLNIVWIDHLTSMLHQWHPHATHTSDARRRRQVTEALIRNRALRRARQSLVVRNNPGW